MTGWVDFADADAALATIARERLHGRVSYIATTRANGAPRVHPLTPIVAERHLFVFMEPTSPKGRDLQRDARYSLHGGVEDNEGGNGELQVNGHAGLVLDGERRGIAKGASPYVPADRYILFELSLDEVRFFTYSKNGPVSRRWSARKSPGENRGHG